jgi:hypothetical protein
VLYDFQLLMINRLSVLIAIFKLVPPTLGGALRRDQGKMTQVNKYGALSILTPRARGGLFENGGQNNTSQ